MDEYATGPQPTIHAERASELVERATPDRVPQVLESCDMLTDATDTLAQVVERLEHRLGPVLNPMSLGTVMREAGDKEPDRASMAQRVRNSAEQVAMNAGRLQQLLDRLEV